MSSLEPPTTKTRDLRACLDVPRFGRDAGSVLGLVNERQDLRRHLGARAVASNTDSWQPSASTGTPLVSEPGNGTESGEAIFTTASKIGVGIGLFFLALFIGIFISFLVFRRPRPRVGRDSMPLDNYVDITSSKNGKDGRFSSSRAEDSRTSASRQDMYPDIDELGEDGKRHSQGTNGPLGFGEFGASSSKLRARPENSRTASSRGKPAAKASLDDLSEPGFSFSRTAPLPPLGDAIRVHRNVSSKSSESLSESAPFPFSRTAPLSPIASPKGKEKMKAAESDVGPSEYPEAFSFSRTAPLPPLHSPNFADKGKANESPTAPSPALSFPVTSLFSPHERKKSRSRRRSPSPSEHSKSFSISKQAPPATKPPTERNFTDTPKRFASPAANFDDPVDSTYDPRLVNGPGLKLKQEEALNSETYFDNSTESKQAQHTHSPNTNTEREAQLEGATPPLKHVRSFTRSGRQHGELIEPETYLEIPKPPLDGEQDFSVSKSDRNSPQLPIQSPSPNLQTRGETNTSWLDGD